MDTTPGQNFSTSPAHSPQSAPLAPWWTRLMACVVATPILVVLGLASWLTPSTSGTGTHTRLGLRPCTLLTHTGYPCPSCGFTTSFTLMAEGRIVDAFVNQPAGAALSIFSAMTAIFALYIAFTGSRIYQLVPRLVNPFYLFPVLVFFLLAWGYKVIVMTW